MEKNKQIEDIISMLDGCVKEGVGHINLQVNPVDGEDLLVETYKTNDCSRGNQACAIPTIKDSTDEE